MFGLPTTGDVHELQAVGRDVLKGIRLAPPVVESLCRCYLARLGSKPNDSISPGCLERLEQNGVGQREHRSSGADPYRERGYRGQRERAALAERTNRVWEVLHELRPRWKRSTYMMTAGRSILRRVQFAINRFSSSSQFVTTVNVAASSLVSTNHSLVRCHSFEPAHHVSREVTLRRSTGFSQACVQDGGRGRVGKERGGAFSG